MRSRFTVPTFILACALAAPSVHATTKTQDTAMQACLKYSHAKDVVEYCVARHGTKRQQDCVARALKKESQRACVIGTWW